MPLTLPIEVFFVPSSRDDGLLCEDNICWDVVNNLLSKSQKLVFFITDQQIDACLNVSEWENA